MKSFVTALIIISVLLSLTVVNAFVISDNLSDIEGDISRLPADPENNVDIDSPADKWKRFRGYLCITVKESILKEGDNLFRLLNNAVEFSDAEQYKYCVTALKSLIADLKKADIPYPFESIIT